MITLKIMSPLPDILKVTRDSRTVTRELAFSPGLTLYGAMELLAQEAPAFARRLADEGEEAVLGGLLFSVDGAVYDRSDRGAAPLRAGCEVKVFMPYAGG